MTPRFDPIPIRKMRPACFTQGAFFAEVSAEGPAVDVKAEAARPERLKAIPHNAARADSEKI